jgi:hypothetical protein
MSTRSPAPYSPSGITPSNVAYSSGWSSVGIASRFSLGFVDAMIVWDTGTYRNVADEDGEPIRMDQAIRTGRVRIWLEGKKLHGGYALTRMGKGKTESLAVREEGR